MGENENMRVRVNSEAVEKRSLTSDVLTGFTEGLTVLGVTALGSHAAGLGSQAVEWFKGDKPEEQPPSPPPPSEPPPGE